MFIFRREWDAVQEELARLREEVISQRDRYEKQIARRDEIIERMQDNLCLVNGAPPVSPAAIDEKRAEKKSIGDQLNQFAEYFLDETPKPKEKQPPAEEPIQ